MKAVGLFPLLASTSVLSKQAAFCSAPKQGGGYQVLSNIHPVNSYDRKGGFHQPAFIRGLNQASSTRLPMAFEQTDSIDVPSIRARLDQYEDTETGAKHFHLRTQDDSSEKAFTVVFKTEPKDSTGVAHILEHSVLAGSEHYPVKDPFFSMMSRSLATFINAMTSSDWTQYPFATLNTKDFFNLLDVYLDAVFFPLLEPLVFAQEGHRLEFEAPHNSTSALIYKGVVYNEMIGAMGSAVADIHQKLSSHLFPDTTYHYNSGGDPQDIPDLTYDQFRQFHADHYNPSNAAFITYGDIPVEEFHAQLEEKVLSRFHGRNSTIPLPTERTLLGPKQVVEQYVFDGEDCTNKTHHVVGWVLGLSGNAQERLEASFLSRALLSNSASPLQRFLDQYPHATAPSALNGLDDHAARMSFMCGIQGSEPEFAEDFEKALYATLEQISVEGVPQSVLESVCHQMELSQREMQSAVRNLFKLLPAVVYDSDPKQFLDMDASLNYLAEQIKDPGYIKQLVKTLLLENEHRVRLTATPDPELSAAREELKREKLAAIQSELTPEQASSIIEQSKALEARQQSVDDPSILPKLSLDDIPSQITFSKPGYRSDERVAKLQNGDRVFNAPASTVYEATTNGISYVKMTMPMPQLTEAEKAVFPIYESLITSLGVGSADYLEMQARQSAITGGIGCFSSVRTSLNSLDSHLGYFGIGTKALNKNLDEAVALMNETFEGVRFDEASRIKELIKKYRLSSEQGLTQSGHQYAMMASASHHSKVSNLEHQLDGLQGVSQLQKIDDSLNDEAAMGELTTLLQSIHSKLLDAPKFALATSDIADTRAVAETVKPNQPGHSDYAPFDHSVALTPGNEVWVTQTESNFCAKSFSAVEESHADAASLKVLSRLLTSENLIRVIRESGGAYGAGASYDQKNGVFSFYSYRDPRNLETVADFDNSVDWLLKTEITSDMLDEAKLATIGGLDRPGTPASEASGAFFTEVQGRDAQSVRAFREAVLNVSTEDLKRVARTYLKSQDSSVAIVTSKKGYEEIKAKSDTEFDKFDV